MSLLKGLHKESPQAKYFNINTVGEYAVEIQKCSAKAVGGDHKLAPGTESFIVEFKVIEANTESDECEVGDVISMIKRVHPGHGARSVFEKRETMAFLKAAFASKENTAVNAVELNDDKTEAVTSAGSLEGVKLLVVVKPQSRNPEYVDLQFKPVRS